MTPAQMFSGQAGLIRFTFGKGKLSQAREGNTPSQFIPGFAAYCQKDPGTQAQPSIFT